LLPDAGWVVALLAMPVCSAPPPFVAAHPPSTSPHKTTDPLTTDHKEDVMTHLQLKAKRNNRTMRQTFDPKNIMQVDNQGLHHLLTVCEGRNERVRDNAPSLLFR
jgi:hypothetical protein